MKRARKRADKSSIGSLAITSLDHAIEFERGEDNGTTVRTIRCPRPPNRIEHDGYVARITLDREDKVYHGRVIDIGDVVTFEAKSSAELRIEFAISLSVY